MTEILMTDLLFPPRIIPDLLDARGKPWKKLISRIIKVDPGSREELAFITMMVRLNGCTSCSSDSYRAMQGCCACTKQSLKRYRGSDDDLTKLYESVALEIDKYLNH